ncbi:uncharacterized protein LOC112503934 [Cynara cardunculus var. scolymus]|uniref:uncharacterized protein LOC112503934 n=1 Tax=Cynara cardunculus var. scolymus TaxID=59895 RepID=UPI000D62E583|nr:uncharacterized protein LOC112503934 [Cynara cardunculus var. scolymus]
MEKPKRRMQLEMQDLEGIKIQVTLWDAFVEELNDYVCTNKDKGIVVLVIQFAMVKIYRAYFIQAKSLIVLGTVKAFRKDVPWFYMGCMRCNRKVRPTYIIIDKDDGSGMKEERENFDCTTNRCRGKQTEVLPKFRISLRVQDDTGIVTLTLFNREANKVLNQTTTELYEKVKESGDLDMFPDELDVLLDRRFAIKIDITDYNIKNNCFIYGISRLTDDDAILSELEMGCASQQPAESESVNLHSTNFSSQDKLKDVVSYTGENATPSDVDKSTADSPESKEKLCERRLGKRVERKRLFESSSDADQEGK